MSISRSGRSFSFSSVPAVTLIVAALMFVPLTPWIDAAVRSTVRELSRRANTWTDAPAADDLNPVYGLDSEWKDQTGATRTLASLRGKPQLIALVYTGCSSTCPLTIQQMKLVEESIGDGAGYVLVSIDPEHDFPATLAAFAKARDLSPKRWTLLTGTADGVRELSAVLGIRYDRVSNAELSHSNVIVLLDADGVVRSQQVGFQGASETIDAIRALMR